MGPFIPGMSLGNMQGIGGPIPGMLGGPVEGLKDRFMQQSQDRAREASMEMQRRASEEAQRTGLEQARDMRREPQFDTFQRGPINMMHQNPFGGGGGMQGFGDLLESGLREQSADRARQEQYQMQMKANEYNLRNAMEQRRGGLNDFQDLLNRRLINSGGRQF